MVDNSMLFDADAILWTHCRQVRFGLNVAFFLLMKLETAKESEKNANTTVPMPLLGRYYPHSKPGGPLSKDTHTSSGLSIYGLGVCA